MQPLVIHLEEKCLVLSCIRALMIFEYLCSIVSASPWGCLCVDLRYNRLKRSTPTNFHSRSDLMK